MTPTERLAADPVLAQALADGLALADLAAALPEGAWLRVRHRKAPTGTWGVDAGATEHGPAWGGLGDSLADAATKALEALLTIEGPGVVPSDDGAATPFSMRPVPTLADLRRLEAAAVREEARRGGRDEYLCPNCQTPWKCNGPHLPEPGASTAPEELMVAARNALPALLAVVEAAQVYIDFAEAATLVDPTREQSRNLRAALRSFTEPEA